MGKKTQKEKEDLRTRLDIQMNLAGDIARRNPRVQSLQEKYWNGLNDENGYRSEYDRLFKEIYGEVFPRFPFPVMRMEELEKSPSELFLRIDLNYTKEEIMFIVEKYVTSLTEKYRASHLVKHKRKSPLRWLQYLEIWDLKDGQPPWVKVGNIKLPYELTTGKTGQKGKSWTYEEIAKHLYPNKQTPKELIKAIDKVKKDYKAACKLICGKKYDPREIEEQKALIGEGNRDKALKCDTCPDRPQCMTLCPPMLRELERVEVKQQHKRVDDLTQLDIEDYQTTRKKYPTADEQFR